MRGLVLALFTAFGQFSAFADEVFANPVQLVCDGKSRYFQDPRPIVLENDRVLVVVDEKQVVVSDTPHDGYYPVTKNSGGKIWYEGYNGVSGSIEPYSRQVVITHVKSENDVRWIYIGNCSLQGSIF